MTASLRAVIAGRQRPAKTGSRSRLVAFGSQVATARRRRRAAALEGRVYKISL
jgi:hypothetical protein